MAFGDQDLDWQFEIKERGAESHFRYNLAPAPPPNRVHGLRTFLILSTKGQYRGMEGITLQSRYQGHVILWQNSYEIHKTSQECKTALTSYY